MPIDWSLLPLPTTALPLKTEFQELETGGYEYLLYSDDGNETALGLPVMTLGNGERRSFLQTNIPVITVNRRAAQAQPEVKSKERVYAFFARWEEGTLEITRAIDHAQFVIKSEALLSSSSGVLPLPVDRVAMPSSPAEDRSVYLACFPDYAITRQSLMGMFSGNAGMVENIQRIGPFQFRMTFRSPHAVGPVLGGRSSIYYARNENIFQDGHVRVSIDPFVLAQTPAGPCDQQQQQLHISFDEAITGSDIYHFFNAISPVSSVYVHPPTPYVSERRKYPRWAVVVFHHRSAVNRILRGAKITTLYLQDREMRVRRLC